MTIGRKKETGRLSVLERRSILEQAAATTLLASMAHEPVGDRTTTTEPTLLPHYVYGIVSGATDRTLSVDAPTHAGSVPVEIEYTDRTEVHRLNGTPPLAELPAGTRIEAGTMLRADDLRSRIAYWINVNPIYSHGDVLSADPTSKTMVVQQAHGGSVRTLHIEADSVIRGQGDPVTVAGLFERVVPGHYVFFTGYTHTADRGCPDVTVAVADGPW